MRIRSPLPYAPFLAALLPTLAIAHGGASLDAARFGSFEDWMIWPLALALLWYFAGYLRLKRHLSADAPRRADAVRFAAAWLVLAATIATPLHEAGEHSFAAHMLEHELLMLVAAPMFVFSRPIGVALWALPSRLRVSAGRMGRRMRGLWQLLTMTLVATAIQAAALWLWHVPSLFELALERTPAGTWRSTLRSCSAPCCSGGPCCAAMNGGAAWESRRCAVLHRDGRAARSAP